MKHLNRILQVMHHIIDKEYKGVSHFKFDEYAWTTRQEKAFEEYLYTYLKCYKQAREELITIPSTDSKLLKNFVSEFLLCYGWRIDDTTKD